MLFLALTSGCPVVVFRRQELRELRLLQKEEQRALAELNAKLEAQKEQVQKRYDQEMNVSLDSSFYYSCLRPMHLCGR